MHCNRKEAAELIPKTNTFLRKLFQYIAGYQPAQKWLKDRKERELSFEDVRHYQRIIVALTETARIMGEIDCGLV